MVYNLAMSELKLRAATTAVLVAVTITAAFLLRKSLRPREADGAIAELVWRQAGVEELF